MVWIEWKVNKIWYYHFKIGCLHIIWANLWRRDLACRDTLDWIQRCPLVTGFTAFSSNSYMCFSCSPGSICQASSAELVGESPRRTRRAKRQMWPVRVVDTSVYVCRSPLLPVSLQLSGIGPLSGLPTVVSACVVVPPREDELTISVGGGGGLR